MSEPKNSTTSTHPYRVAHGLTFVPAHLYDALRDLLASGRELRDRVVLTPMEVEAQLERHGITPTGEAGEAFRLGVAYGRAEGCECGGNCACKPPARPEISE